MQILALLLALLAHHGSRVSYDLTRTVTLTGIVKEVSYTNPHVYFTFDVKDAQGKVTEWGAETDPPIMLERRYNWSKKYVKVGDRVAATVTSTDARWVRWRSVTPLTADEHGRLVFDAGSLIGVMRPVDPAPAGAYFASIPFFLSNT